MIRKEINNMPKYNVNYIKTVTYNVEAKDENEAEEIAFELRWNDLSENEDNEEWNVITEEIE
jgi:hypothetical protein